MGSRPDRVDIQQSLINSAIALVLTIALDLMTIPVWGTLGAAAAAAIAVSLVSVAQLIQVYWLLGIWPYDRTFLKPLIAAAVVAVAGIATSRLLPHGAGLLYLVAGVSTMWLSYAGITILLGLAEEDRDVLSHAVRRFSSALAQH